MIRIRHAIEIHEVFGGFLVYRSALAGSPIWARFDTIEAAYDYRLGLQRAGR